MSQVVAAHVDHPRAASGRARGSHVRRLITAPHSPFIQGVTMRDLCVAEKARPGRLGKSAELIDAVAPLKWGARSRSGDNPA